MHWGCTAPPPTGVGVLPMHLRAGHSFVARPAACRQPCARLVTDIALSNRQAWQFFTAMGFTRGAASGQTAEAWLVLQPGSSDAPAARTLPPAAAAATMRSSRSASFQGSRTSAGCSTAGTSLLQALPLPRRPAAQPVPRPAILQAGLHHAVHTRVQVTSAWAKGGVGIKTL
jgi:hypothetical protein